MPKQRWKPIEGCSNYLISSNGVVKRKKHVANGKKHKIIPEAIVKQVNVFGCVTVRITNDNGKQCELSVQKLVVTNFLEKGKSYYKLSDNAFHNGVNMFLEIDLYNRMKEDRPAVFKIVKT